MVLFCAYQESIATPGRSDVPPVQPDYVFGKVRINGAFVPAGTSVSAWCDGVMVAETMTIIETVGEEDQSWYSLEIPADDPLTLDKDGCIDGEEVAFKINAFDADQSKLWVEGGVPLEPYDLSVNNLLGIFLPLILK
ncbi:MAG TPA: hypothetical protein VIM80_01575 [Brevefilum sp.]